MMIIVKDSHGLALHDQPFTVIQIIILQSSFSDNIIETCQEFIGPPIWYYRLLLLLLLLLLLILL